jgi:hypothetical protein
VPLLCNQVPHITPNRSFVDAKSEYKQRTHIHKSQCRQLCVGCKPIEMASCPHLRPHSYRNQTCSAAIAACFAVA